MSRMFTEKEIFDFYSKHNISVKENEKEFSRGSIVKPFEKLDWPIDNSKSYRSTLINNSSQKVIVRGNHGQLEPNTRSHHR